MGVELRQILVQNPEFPYPNFAVCEVNTKTPDKDFRLLFYCKRDLHGNISRLHFGKELQKEGILMQENLLFNLSSWKFLKSEVKTQLLDITNAYFGSVSGYENVFSKMLILIAVDDTVR